jgi:hypothetical protein
MKRLEYLHSPAREVRYPKDVKLLKESIPELSPFTDGEVQDLYSDWSEDYLCASWLYPSEGNIAEFREYLNEEVDSTGHVIKG